MKETTINGFAIKSGDDKAECDPVKFKLFGTGNKKRRSDGFTEANSASGETVKHGFNMEVLRTVDLTHSPFKERGEVKKFMLGYPGEQSTQV